MSARDLVGRAGVALDALVGVVLVPPTGVALGLALTAGSGPAAWLAAAVFVVGVALLAAYTSVLPA